MSGTIGRGLGALVAALAISLLVAVPALAAGQRYASPTGTSAAPCTSAQPCDIATAINSGSNGDEVIVEPGTYGSAGTPLTTQLAPPNTETIHGVAGQPRPVIYDTPGASEALYINNPSTATYLDIETNTTVAVFVAAGAADQLVAHTTSSSGEACDGGFQATITNSICWASGDSGIGEGTQIYCSTPFPATLRNVDAYGTGPNGIGIQSFASNSGCQVAVSATNVIARGTLHDVQATASSSGSDTITFDHSDFATVVSSGATVSAAGSGTNITTDPALANPAAGDFHETSGSPTIDTGITDSANGTFDFEGQPRTALGKTDIGADEYFPLPAVTATAPTAIGMQGATLNGIVNPDRSATTYSFHYGTTPAMSSATSPQPIAAGTAAQPVAGQIGGLPARTTVYWQLVATNLAGTSATPVQQFTTSPAPPAPPPPPLTGSIPAVAAVVSNATESNSTWREGNQLVMISRKKAPIGTTFKFSLNEAATVRFDFTQPAAGRKVSGKCVAQTKHNKHKPKCQRTIVKGTFSFTGHAGVNSVVFDGRVSPIKKLTVGKYTLVITATTTGGSTSKKLTFTIVK